jgi:pyruvate kinase
VARINMSYFDLEEQQESVNNIRKACEITGKQIAIMVDLKGPLIRTLGFKDMYSVKVKEHQEIRLSSN